MRVWLKSIVLGKTRVLVGALLIESSSIGLRVVKYAVPTAPKTAAPVRYGSALDDFENSVAIASYRVVTYLRYSVQ